MKIAVQDDQIKARLTEISGSNRLRLVIEYPFEKSYQTHVMQAFVRLLKRPLTNNVPVITAASAGEGN